MRGAWLATAMLFAGCDPRAVSEARARDACPGQAIGGDVADARQVLGSESRARITLENDVADCVALAPQRLIVQNNLEILEFSLKWIKETGHCACKSSVLAYRVIETMDVPADAKELGETGEYQRAFGVVEPRPADTRISIVVTSDHRGFASTPLKLRVQCRAPD